MNERSFFAISHSGNIASPSSVEPKMRPNYLFLLIPAALLGLSACGERTAGGPAGGPVPVTVVTLAPQQVTVSRELPGRTRASVVAEVRPQVTGIVKEVLFEEGGAVRAGQPLYQLDDATYRADVERARAALARAKATLDAAGKRAARSALLVKDGLVGAQDHDNVIAALGEAEADVAVAQAALATATVVLGHARIVSPIAGQVGRSAVTRGALVTANQSEALASVQQLDPLFVDLAQSSGELLELRRAIEAGRLEAASGLPVTLLLEDGSEHPQPGRLAFSEVTVDPGTGRYILRVVVPNPGQLLMPGMYVRARVGGGIRQDALLVPQQAVQRDPRGGTSVLLAGADGKVELRQVSVSRTIGDAWLVEDGLAAGDRVIIEGLQKVRPGAEVTATERPVQLAPHAPDPA
ncbi:MAG: efflux RND transporter periplasmic adaptor subunit [Steroidobacteraceae bacterium]|jgi:membrane fusion protein (multidrug efflux system)|nr:efflux RND transporter periplasmic adaptor subunit [Steroidobacteraceae bacterium]